MKKETANIQRIKDVEQEQLLGYWLKRHGLSRKDIETHPHINDLILLIHWKNEFYRGGKAKHKTFFDNVWKWVYNNRQPLKAEQLKTLGYYAEGTIRHRENLAAGRNTIKKQREYRKALAKA